MNLLLAAATADEIAPVSDQLKLHPGLNQFDQNSIYLLITGVGMVATSFALGRELAERKYNLALNLGIAGSFDRRLVLGDTVEITEDHFAELGAEDGDSFISIDELGFGTGRQVAVKEENYRTKLPKVRGITVNKVHGNESSIQKVINQLDPITESMEGAAFFYACSQINLPSIQVRSISNYVEKRNRSNWKIGLAIKNLNIFAADFLEPFTR